MKKLLYFLVLGLAISALSIMVDAHTESEESQVLIDRLLSVEKPRPKSGQPTREHLAIAELARTIGKNKDISPQIRVNVLTTVLSKEIEDPCSLNLIPNGYLTLSGYLQRQYIFALVDIGFEAIPNLRRHLKHLELRMELGSGSLGKPQSVKHRSNVVVEKQLTLCTLGFHRDKTVFPEVMDIFLETEDGYVRSLAAMALEKLNNRAAIPALKRALKDDFHVTFTTCVVRRNSGNRRIIYPVREAASSSLRAMGVKVVRKGNNFRVVQ